MIQILGLPIRLLTNSFSNSVKLDCVLGNIQTLTAIYD